MQLQEEYNKKSALLKENLKDPKKRNDKKWVDQEMGALKDLKKQMLKHLQKNATQDGPENHKVNMDKDTIHEVNEKNEVHAKSVDLNLNNQESNNEMIQNVANKTKSVMEELNQVQELHERSVVENKELKEMLELQERKSIGLVEKYEQELLPLKEECLELKRGQELAMVKLKDQQELLEVQVKKERELEERYGAEMDILKEKESVQKDEFQRLLDEKVVEARKQKDGYEKKIGDYEKRIGDYEKRIGDYEKEIKERGEKVKELKENYGILNVENEKAAVYIEELASKCDALENEVEKAGVLKVEVDKYRDLYEKEKQDGAVRLEDEKNQFMNVLAVKEKEMTILRNEMEILEKKKQIEVAKDNQEISELKIKLVDLKNKLQIVEDEKVLSNNTVEELRQEIQESTTANKASIAIMESEWKSKVENYQLKLANIQDSNLKASIKAKETQQATSQLQEERNKLQSQLTQIRGSVNDADKHRKNELKRATARATEATQALTTQQAQNMSLKQQITQLQQEKVQLKNQAQTNEDAIVVVRKEQGKLQNLISELKTSGTKSTAKLNAEIYDQKKLTLTITGALVAIIVAQYLFF